MRSYPAIQHGLLGKSGESVIEISEVWYLSVAFWAGADLEQEVQAAKDSKKGSHSF